MLRTGTTQDLHPAPAHESRNPKELHLYEVRIHVLHDSRHFYKEKMIVTFQSTFLNG